MNNKENTNKMVKDECINHIHLIDVANVLYGYPLQAKNFCEDSSYLPVVRIRDIKAGFSTTYYRESVPMEYIVHLGDILVGMDGEFNLSKWRSREAILNQRVCKIESKDESIILNQYLFHLLGPIFKKIEKNIQGSTVKHLSAKIINSIKIPLPPLPIQQEIVRILDTFTNLTAELTAELTARRKQYEYYRDELLTFGEDIERRTIGDVCLKIASGGTPATGKMEYYGGDIPWLRTQEVDWNDIWDTGVKISKAGLENSSAKWIPENCVVVAMYGATAAKVAVNRIPLTTNQACCNLLINEKIVMHRYVFYWLSKEYLHLKEMGQGSQSNINAKIIRNYLIPIPPMERQQYIVSILDRFRELCSAFSGISEEILLRQKQYEYYRDKLLNFREK